MDIARNLPLIASGLIFLVGVGCGVGGLALYGGKPSGWTDVVANDALLRRVSVGLLLTSALLLASGISGAFRLPHAPIAGVIAIVLFVVGGFWGNYAVFGDIRPLHTGGNVVIATLILSMLWASDP
jgi:hypothetical protein